jgi:beta-xylosidase
VFKEGGSSDWDYGGVETVSVLKSNNVYWLWYAGYPVRSSSLPLNLKIGAATSNDGITWTRASTSPVLDKGSPGAWDDGWVESPTVIQVNGTFYMWYTGVSTSLNFQIGLAASSDGINWTKQPTPVLSANPANAWENGGVYAPSVIWDGTHIIMWYVGFNSSTFLNATQIGMATSTDGINWTRSTLNPVLGLGQSGSFDEKGPFVPSVLQKDGQYQMWYLRGNSGQEKVGFATATEISGN